FDSAIRRQYKPAHVRPLRELFDLSGRTAIVTGASRGLGQEIAEGLAEAGATLMVCARREQWLTPTLAEMRAAGHPAGGVVADVANRTDVKAIVEKTTPA